MYTNFITSQDKAICHLFLHCCFKDGNFTEDEMENVSRQFTDLDMHKQLDFKEELNIYRSYKEDLFDEKGYLEFIIKQIAPTQEMALYAYCVELALSDASISNEETHLLNLLAQVLNINEEEQQVIERLCMQLLMVRLQKFF